MKTWKFWCIITKRKYVLKNCSESLHQKQLRQLEFFETIRVVFRLFKKSGISHFLNFEIISRITKRNGEIRVRIIFLFKVSPFTAIFPASFYIICNQELWFKINHSNSNLNKRSALQMDLKIERLLHKNLHIWDDTFIFFLFFKHLLNFQNTVLRNTVL